MSTRPYIAPQQVVTSGDMSANLTSTPTFIPNVARPSYAVNWSGTSPVGTLSVQTSSDYALSADGQSVANAGHWATMTLLYNGAYTTTVALSGNTGTAQLDLTTSVPVIRLIYTFGSGVGTMNAFINAKV